MTLNNFLAGIDIVRPYYDDPDGHHIAAEHDIFYLYATSRPMSEEDVKGMRVLGWFQEGIGDVYDPNEGWAAFP